MNWKKLDRIISLIWAIEDQVLHIPFKERKYNNMKRFTTTCGICYNTLMSQKHRDNDISITDLNEMQRGLQKGIKEYEIEDLINIDLIN